MEITLSWVLVDQVEPYCTGLMSVSSTTLCQIYGALVSAGLPTASHSSKVQVLISTDISGGMWATIIDPQLRLRLRLLVGGSTGLGCVFRKETKISAC